MADHFPPALRFGFGASPFADVDALADQAVRAERAGFDTFLLPDVPGGLSPLIALTAVARATTTLRVGTFVLNTGWWNPPTAVRELATLDRVSGGRLEITLGSGVPAPGLGHLLPPTPQGRFDRLVDTLDALDAAQEDPGAGPAFTAPPRVLIAGTAERTARLAAERTDGFFVALVPPVPKVPGLDTRQILPELGATERHLEKVRGWAGPRADGFEIGTSTTLVVTDDAEAAAHELAGTHTYLTPAELLESPKLLAGTTAEIAARIVDRAARLGLTYTVLRGEPEVLADILARARPVAG